MGKKFHIGDVLSVTTGWVLSKRGFQGVCDVLNYMTGERLQTISMPRAADVCVPAILKQHPLLEGPEITEAVEQYKKRAEAPDADHELLAIEWLVDIVKRFGEELELEPLPKGNYRQRAPEVELNMLGVSPDKIITFDPKKAD